MTADWYESLFWSAARRVAALNLEAAQIDNVLSTYWNAASGLASVPTGRYMVRHQNDRETCSCTLCSDWRIRRLEVEKILPLMDGHRWGNCPCPVCAVGRQLHFGFLGTTNRRDLWTEMAYHAHTDPVYRNRAIEVLSLVRVELENPARSLNWWALEGGRMPMAFWFRKIDKALKVQRQKEAA